MNENKAILFLGNYWKSILYVIFVFYVSLMRTPSFPSMPKIEHLDKIVHVLLYFVMAAIIYRDFMQAKQPVSFAKAVIAAILFPVLTGGLIEILQSYFPPRTADWVDFAADILGAVIGFFVARFFFLKKENLEK